jgi:hypothetical protein
VCPTRTSSRSSVLPNPKPGAYGPHVAARRPGGRPPRQPQFRVLVHRQYLEVWNNPAERIGLENAQQFWDHLALTPGEHPRVGTSSVMKGKHNGPKWPGYSKTIHYGISGTGRIDYQYNPGEHRRSPALRQRCRQDPHSRSREPLTSPRQPSVFLPTFCQPTLACRDRKRDAESHESPRQRPVAENFFLQR